MHIRLEEREDIPRIHALHHAAFGSTLEGDIVAALRTAGGSVISLVAVDEGAIAGHILLSPATITGADGAGIVALGPMAVLPGWQRGGIGAALVEAGLHEYRVRGVQAVFVVGHAGYDPRFGFVQAATFGISCEFDVPADALMVLELVAGALRQRAGVLHFHKAFRSP